jgi:hypothetical protein
MSGIPLKLALVYWSDSAQASGAWRHMEDLPEPEAIDCASVGWIVKEDDEVLMIAQSMGDIGTDNTQCAGIKQIPKCCITEIKILQRVYTK